MHTPATNLSGDPVPVRPIAARAHDDQYSWVGSQSMQEGNHLGNSRPSVLAPALDIKSTALNQMNQRQLLQVLKRLDRFQAINGLVPDTSTTPQMI